MLEQAAQHHDHILLVPSASHAFDKQSLPFDVRVAMLAGFVRDIDLTCELSVSTVESELLAANPHKPVYTYDLLTTLQSQHQGHADISFIRGPDNALPDTWRRFYRHKDIETQWSIFTAVERLNIRSSFVRKHLQGSSAAPEFQQALLMLTPSVQTFILDHHLYQSGAL